VIAQGSEEFSWLLATLVLISKANGRDGWEKAFRRSFGLQMCESKRKVKIERFALCWREIRDLP
jgi:hypothetical protein